MIITNNNRQFLLVLSVFLCGVVPANLMAATLETPPPWSMEHAATIRHNSNVDSAENAGSGSGISSWYQSRQRNLSSANSNLEGLQSRSDAGDSDAQYQLGMIYQSGRGVQQSLPLAKQLFGRAAQSGNAYAQYALALLLRSQGDQAAMQKSVQLQEKAALGGHPEAQYGLGMLYANGQYVARDLYKARHWLQQAQQRGNMMAQLALRELPVQTAAIKPKQPVIQRPVAIAPGTQKIQQYAAQIQQPVESVKPVRRPVVAAKQPAAVQPVIATAAPTLPTVSSAPDEAKITVKHNQSSVNLEGMSPEQIRSAAQQGNRYAQLMLGALYEDGSDGVSQDYAKALEWYLKSARQGYPKAQHNLALLYEDGRGTSQNYRQAANWYRKAADAGFSEAQNNLAVLYILGNGVEADRTYAEKLLRQAVAKGNANAERNLSMLLNGEG
ncbi:MAG: tetratricopeptide repeat protein [Thiolinea sp.]